MPALLFEIGCEELPASAVDEAAGQLSGLVREHVGANPNELYVGPRRLAFLVRELSVETAEEWIQGPPVRVGEKAAEGFARKLGVPREALVERDGVLGWVKPPEPRAIMLPERLLAIVSGLRFAKSMRWDRGVLYRVDGEVRTQLGPSGRTFSRPVRWLCAKLDDQTLEGFAFEGAVMGGHSYGHRFTSGRIEIPHAEAYAEVLRAAAVEPSAAARRDAIVAALHAIGDWRDPAGVLDEVVHLVESPVVLAGEFDDRFLRLPPRVVETAMQSHQRYFPLGGNRFAFVANGGDPDVVRDGNERVLEGRLEDASFSFERDVAVGIEELARRLGAITFFQGAGSYADKTERLVALARELGGDGPALEAARLAKADQGSELVREFPELEGHIGAEYARLAGKPLEVCVAIDEQYLPDAADAPLPSTAAGRVLAAADKLDTLTVSFGLGHRPTGSRDPYGLRRAAIGICRLALEGGVPIRIDDPEVRDFVEERLEGLLDVPVEFVRAARGARPVGTLGAVAELARFVAGLEHERLATVHEVYTRCRRIVGDRADEEPVDASLLRERAERALFAALPNGVWSASFQTTLDWALGVAPLVARFFDDVLVMDPDAALRANRLRLLRDVRDAVGRLGDLSQIPL